MNEKVLNFWRMSLGYADKLSYREDLGGPLGQKEHYEPGSSVEMKAKEIASLIRQSGQEGLVVHTGAGISTGSGVPDFRGPNGVWTKRKRGESPPKGRFPMDRCKPSKAHMAVKALLDAGHVAMVCTANVDNLHRRSGIPNDKLCELHGNCLTEMCPCCETRHVRDFEVETVGFNPTGRECNACGEKLVDFVLDWESEVPHNDLERAESASSNCQLSLALGTSLRIVPAADLPAQTLRHGGDIAIVNLQKTPVDSAAQVVVHSTVDSVLARVVHLLGLPLPAYTREDRVRIRHEVTDEGRISVQLLSSHGDSCKMPWLSSARIETLGEGGSSEEVEEQPFRSVTLAAPGMKNAKVRVSLRLAEELSKGAVELERELAGFGCEEVALVTDELAYTAEADALGPVEFDGSGSALRRKRRRR